MATQYFKTIISFPEESGVETTMNYYDKFDDVVTTFATEKQTKEDYVVQCATKQNKWFSLDTYTINSAIITKAEYNKFIADAVNPDSYIEDLTPPDILPDNGI